MKRKVLCAVFTFLVLCGVTACGMASDVQYESERISSVAPKYSASSVSNEISTIQDDIAMQLPGGNIDYSVYEPYGLIYDPQNGGYMYNGSIVRQFNDPAAGASFTNYFTGTVDLEAEYDTNNILVGVKECSREVYDRHTEKYNSFSAYFADQGTDNTIQHGNSTHNIDSLKDYETYGIFFNMENGGWYFNNNRIRILIDSEIASVYLDDKGGVCLCVVRNKDHTIAEMKEITEAEANALMGENDPQNNGDITVED